MSAESFLGGKAMLCCGDSIHFMRDQPENRYDSIVCDPPYALVSIVNRFGSDNAAPAKDGIYKRSSSGFMGKKWDTGDSAHDAEFWREALRVLKPGGYVLAFAGTRTYHRLACAIEDSGFEIRDMISWLYGSGFPKSHDVSKGIDRAAGAEREVVGSKIITGLTPDRETFGANDRSGGKGMGFRAGELDITAPATESARQWAGWGTALKPACEPICMARKPLSEGTVAANVQKWGTGAINVDECRIVGDLPLPFAKPSAADGYSLHKRAEDWVPNTTGRWPANVIHDGSEEVVAGFPETASGGAPTAGDRNGVTYGEFARRSLTSHGANDGSAARFFYTAKADSDDRLGSKHPTVKPVDLMQYLVRLVTPKGGLVLDPFAGTGTTAEACFREGMICAMVEREPEYQADIRRRMALVMGGPEERRRESIKAKKLPIDHGPLFSCG